MKITLFASLKLLYTDDVIRTVSHKISLSHADLADGINSFCGKVHSAIDDILYEVLANSGSIEDTIRLDITPNEYNLSYTYQIFKMPSKSTKKEIDELIDEIEKNLRKDLCHAIIFSLDYQSQYSCSFQETQAENTK